MFYLIGKFKDEWIIFAIRETNLIRQKSFSLPQVLVFVHLQKREKKRGGVTIVSHKNYRIINQKPFETDHLEAINVTLASKTAEVQINVCCAN